MEHLIYIFVSVLETIFEHNFRKPAFMVVKVEEPVI